MDVAAWLRALGLEQHAQLFRDNDIDGEILCGMTAEDLKELGISSFGHRRKLLNAITALGGEPPTLDVAQSATSATSAPTSPPPIDAERRQLTVMFCDLVGSTELSARLLAAGAGSRNSVLCSFGDQAPQCRAHPAPTHAI